MSSTLNAEFGVNLLNRRAERERAKVKDGHCTFCMVTISLWARNGCYHDFYHLAFFSKWVSSLASVGAYKTNGVIATVSLIRMQFSVY
jgi:hypothetical protein